MDKVGFWGRLSVGRKISLIGVLFLSAIFGIISYTVMEQRETETNSLVMDIAGRQRVLVQLYVKDVILSSQGHKVEPQYWSAVYFESLDGLLDGGKVTQTLKKDAKIMLPPAPTQAIRDKLSETKSLFDELSSMAAQLARISGDNPAYASKVADISASSMKLHSST